MQTDNTQTPEKTEKEKALQIFQRMLDNNEISLKDIITMQEQKSAQKNSENKNCKSNPENEEETKRLKKTKANTNTNDFDIDLEDMLGCINPNLTDNGQVEDKTLTLETEGLKGNKKQEPKAGEDLSDDEDDRFERMRKAMLSKQEEIGQTVELSSIIGFLPEEDSVKKGKKKKAKAGEDIGSMIENMHLRVEPPTENKYVPVRVNEQDDYEDYHIKVLGHDILNKKKQVDDSKKTSDNDIEVKKLQDSAPCVTKPLEEIEIKDDILDEMLAEFKDHFKKEEPKQSQ